MCGIKSPLMLRYEDEKRNVYSALDENLSVFIKSKINEISSCLRCRVQDGRLVRHHGYLWIDFHKFWILGVIELD